MHTDTSSHLWSSLRHPQVRNLAWCIFSPSLVVAAGQPCPETAFQTCEPVCSEADMTWLMQLDAAPEPLLGWMAGCHSARLGFQFEYYWQFWWHHRHPQLEYRFNVQLSDASGRTRGELDALSWHPERQQLTHTELAVKFYLGVASETLPAGFQPPTAWSWVGPNVKDRLDLKWQQLQQRQLRHLWQRDDLSLLHTGLPAHWHCGQLQTRLIMRGRLFYPLAVQPDWAETPYINLHHQPGIWLSLSQFLDPGSPAGARHRSASRWQILRREQWFAPLLCTIGETLDFPATAQRLGDYFGQHHQPLQLAEMQPATGLEGEFWQEDRRWFVVPDQWPACNSG